MNENQWRPGWHFGRNMLTKTSYGEKHLCPPSHFTWPAFHTVAEHRTDSEILRGQFHHQTDMYKKRLQQQITWVQTLLFVLVLLLVIRWQGLQFLEGEILAPHWPPISLHNNPWQHTTPCGQIDTDTESHLWGIFQGQWTFMSLFHVVCVNIWCLHFTQSTLRVIIKSELVAKNKHLLRRTLTSLPSKRWSGDLQVKRHLL